MRKPAHATVLSTVALIAAAGGGAAAAAPAAFSAAAPTASIAKHKTKCNTTCQETKLFNKLAKKAKVAYATKAGTATTATNAMAADTAKTATTANNATTAGSANTANTANVANVATNAANATNATNAANATTVGGQTVKTFNIPIATDATSPTPITLGEVALGVSCNGNFQLGAAAVGSATGTLNFAGVDAASQAGFSRSDSSFSSSSGDNLTDGTTNPGSGTADALMSDGTIETIDYAYATTATGCAYWGRAIY